jgi:uncharacterized membrane protein
VAFRRWEWAVWQALVALAVAVLVLGALERGQYLVFGGMVILLIAATMLLQARALRPGADEALPSNAEKAAWGRVGMGLATTLLLGGMVQGPMRGVMSGHLLLGFYAVLIVFYPMFRRRSLEENRRHREVLEDERDRAIRASGDYLARRSLECMLVGLAVVWVLVPQLIRPLGEPLQIAALLLFPILASNIAGEARVAHLYWRDRQ